MVEAVVQDLKYAARGLARNPGLSATMILTLALGIGATTAIFSVVYGVLLRALPYPEPNRLAAIWEVNRRGTYSRLADPNFDDFRDQNHTFQAMAKYRSGTLTVTGTAEPTRTGVAFVTHDFFNVLRVDPVMGRSFTVEDAHPRAAPVLLASYGYWKEYLASTRDLSTVKLRIRDRLYSVVGILPEQFVGFPANADLWVSSELDRESTSRTSHNYLGVGRLRQGPSMTQANTDLAAIAAGIVRQSPEQSDYLMRSAAVVPLQTALTGQVRSPLYVLLGAVGLLLFVACANVANLLLAQASKRAQELALRNALGAGRGRLIRQFITETMLLSGVGGATGILIAVAVLRILLALTPPDLPRVAEVTVSWPALIFTAAVSCLAAVGLGILTALRATSGAPRATLVDGRGGTGTERSQRVGRVIVSAQLAITLAMLTGAGLLGRSLLRVLSVDPGFRTDHVVAMDLQLPEPGDLKPDAVITFRAHQSQLVSGLVERLQAIPGMQQVAAVNAVPMDGGLPDGMFLVVSPQDNPRDFKAFGLLAKQTERRGSADFCAASPKYFQALGIPLVRGRFFDERDGFNAPHVAVISESLARSRWARQDPIGQTIQFGNMDGDLHLLTIVGVAADTHEYGLEQPPRPTVYVNLMQRPRSTFSVVMHTEADANQATAAARAIVRDEAPDTAPRFRTFTQIYSASLGSRRFNLTLVVVFALTALLLAVAGVYGVVSFGVAQRTREIGVRVALGARRVDVLSLILRQGMATTLFGVAIGVAGSFATARTIQALLFEVAPTDPLTFGVVAASLTVVAGLACYIPARRATQVDPMVALRNDR